MEWSQPPNQSSGGIPKNVESKIGAPDPRYCHTGVYLKTLNSVAIFGGHGGVHYQRKSFNDLYMIDCDEFEWKKIEALGQGPSPRGGHVAGLMPNQKDMFIHGGWSNIGQFSNLYVYQVDNNTWIEVNINMDLPRWNHSAILIPALPRWKLFFFGGSSGYFDEGQP